MNGPFYPRCGPSLTHIHRCGTVAGKESESSVASGTRIRNTRGFFVPAFLRREGGSDTRPRKGKAAHRLATAFYLPAPLRAASESVTARLKPQLGDVLMHAPIPFLSTTNPFEYSFWMANPGLPPRTCAVFYGSKILVRQLLFLMHLKRE